MESKFVAEIRTYNEAIASERKREERLDDLLRRLDTLGDREALTDEFCDEAAALAKEAAAELRQMREELRVEKAKFDEPMGR